MPLKTIMLIILIIVISLVITMIYSLFFVSLSFNNYYFQSGAIEACLGTVMLGGFELDLG